MAEEKGPDKKTVKEVDSLLKQILDKAMKTEKTFAQLTNRGRDLAGTMQAMGAELGKSGDALQKMGQMSETFLKTADKTQEAHKQIKDQIKERFDLEMALATTDEQRLQAAIQYNAEKANEKNAADSLKSMAESQVQAQQSLIKLQVAKNTGLRGEALSAASSYQLMVQQGAMTKEQYNDIVKNLKEQQDITQELEDQLEMEEAIAQEILDIERNTESWGKSLQKTAATAKAIASDPKALGLFALNEASKAAGKLYEGFEDLRHEGMSAGQALDASFKTFSVNSVLGLSDTQGAVKGLVDEFGTINNVSADTIDQIGTVAHEMGISGQEAASLTAQMSQMAGETTEVAANTLEYTNELAKANGIAPGKITKEMAANTKNMHKFTKGGSKEFAKIAVEAHKIGISMDTAANAASGLLDYESSIEAQMEASVLLGKEINLDKARQLALEGHSVEAAKEIVAQAGGLKAFQQMNVLEQEAYAKAANMSVDELTKAMDAEENKGKLSEENADQASEHAGHMMEVAMKMGGFLKNNAMLMMTMAQFIMNGNAEKAIGYAKDMAHWVKEKAHMAWKMATGQSITKQATEGAGEAAGKMLKKDGTPDMRFKANKAGDKAADAAGGSVDKTADVSKKAEKQPPLKNFQTAMKNLRKGLQEFGKKPMKTLQGVATLAAAGVLLAVGLAAIFGAMTVVGGPMEMIAAGLALVGFAISFRIMADSLKAVKVSSIIQGALAMVILGAALVTAAFAFSLLKGVDTGAMIVFAIALPLLALAAAGLGFLAPYIMMGAAALAVLGLAMIPAALAFKMLGDVDPMMIVNFAAGILVLAAAAALMGMAIIPLMLGSIAIGMLSASLVVLGVGLMAITAGLPGIDGLSKLLSMMAEQGMASAAGLLATGGAMFVFAGALLTLAFASFFGAPALIVLAGAMLVLGTGVALAAGGMKIMAEALPAMADGMGAIGKVAPMLGLASLFLMELGAAAFISSPGLIIGSLALGMLAATMTMFAAAVTLAMPGVGMLIQLGSMAESFAMIAASMWSMAAGIAAFATAGLLTLPTIMGLIALSFVAPILTLLGDSINYDLQGGGGSSIQSKPEESEMKILIEEVRQLRAAFQTPGVINMDGQKVGDVIGLAVSNSGVS